MEAPVLTSFPRHGDNFTTLDIDPDLDGRDPDEIARIMTERRAHARKLSAERAAEGDSPSTAHPPRHPATNIGE